MTDKIPAVGSRILVWRGHAKHTSGGLTKKDLMRHRGRIISRKKHAAGLRSIKHLHALGFKPKKGTFKLMRKSMAHHSPKKHSRKHSRRHTRRRRGGAGGVPSLAHMDTGSGAAK